MSEVKNELMKSVGEMSHLIKALQQRLAEGLSPVPADRVDELLVGIKHLSRLFSNIAFGKGVGNRATVCNSCEKRDTCDTECDRVTKVIGRPYTGKRGSKEPEGFENLPMRQIKNSSSGLYRLFLSHAYLFTRKQWAVVELYYGEGKKQEAIAQTLNISCGGVSERLTRAKVMLAKVLAQERTREDLKSDEDT